MADDIITDQSQPAATQSSVPADVAQMMELSLNGPKPQETGAAENQDQTAVATANTPPTSTDVFQPFKEKFGYQSPEDAIKEIEELRSFKAIPQTREEIKFENEKSEKLFRALQKGDRKEVYAILSEEEKLETLTSSEITESNAADVIKLGMALKYKDLSQAEIDYKFNKQYAIPKEPVKSEEEDDESFAQRKAEWQECIDDVKMSKIIDAKLSKPELELAKSKIVLPEISDDVDEGYIQYKKSLEAQSQQQVEIEAAYKSFTPKTVETKIPFTDEANKIGFEFQYEPDSESFNKSVEMALDINQFFGAFKNQDGTPDRQKFLNAIHFAMNRDRILMEAMKQAKNATIKSFLPDNSQGGMIRQMPQTQEPSELDKMMQASLNVGTTRR